MATRTSSSPLPKSGPALKGYNFASTWEQNAPLTEQQQAAIAALSHAVSERPFPINMVDDTLDLFNQLQLQHQLVATKTKTLHDTCDRLLNPLLEEIESRSLRKEYAQLLAECHWLYCEQGLSLVRGIVHQLISEFAKKEALPSLTRSGCAYLMQVCQLEHQLFDHFFPSSSEDVSSLAPLIDPLYDFLLVLIISLFFLK
ncbi:conserved oligomeric Golgi complex subunit 3-like isoform X4 [Macadamia integrifolia]|uniref:conserved oligomeric Golgi complex subunit 3-like isoform X4 n=1 Tax=Macadamia integrifolia TaxID=60698 RepID=UPI001C4EF6EB|nr:conserved oligomeric Golgi complex subunit 3-like isoform X4 [Macadamia integrifolia]